MKKQKIKKKLIELGERKDILGLEKDKEMKGKILDNLI